MFSHVMVGATNIEESRKFYDAIMPTIGGKPGVPHKLKGIMRYLYFHKGNIFIITEPINGEDAAHGNGSTLGFQADSPEIVNAWHKAGLDNGGTAIEDGQHSFKDSPDKGQKEIIKLLTTLSTVQKFQTWH